MDRIELQKVLALHGRADAEKQQWASYFEEIAKYFIPIKDNVYGANISGDKKQVYLFDSTSVHSNEIFASVLHTLISSPTQEFFDMATGNPTVDRRDDVRAYRQEVTTILHSVLNSTNYHVQAHEGFLDVGSFGTMVLKKEDHPTDIRIYDAIPVYNFSFLENSKGEVDTVFRKFEYTLKQLVEEYPETVTDELKRRSATVPDEKHWVLHAVLPRTLYDPSKKNKKSKPFASLYILLTDNTILSEGGFKKLPYIITRFQKIAGETYGRSPAMKALPDAQNLNQLQKTLLQIAHKKGNPTYLLADDGVIRPFKTAPGSINYFRSGMQNPVQVLDNNADPSFIAEVSESCRERIRKAFYIDRMFLREGPQMTATEVIQRAEEQLRTMGPTGGRFVKELLEPLIEDLYEEADSRGLLPEPPPILAELSLKVRFKSSIAKSQNMLEVENFNRYLGAIVPLSQMYPEILTMMQPDDMLKHVAEMFHIPQNLLADEEQVDMTREQMVQQGVQQQEMNDESMRADILLKQAQANNEIMKGGLGAE